MTVSITVAFTVPAVEKHRQQMQQAAQSLTNAKNSVEILQHTGESKITARFTVPTARHDETANYVARTFWDFIEDYSDSSIGFSSESRRKAG
jgi:hypothetical protein